MTRQDFKKSLIVAHDLTMTAIAIVATFYVRFDGRLLDERLTHLSLFLPPFVIFAGFVYWFFQLYRSKWRFASLPDLFNIFRATSVLALALLVTDYVLVSPQLFGFYFFGKITIALYWLIQMFLLGGPRLAFRYMKYARSRHTIQRDANTPVLVLGRGSDVEVFLRAVESGAVKKLQPKGVLSYRADELGQAIRGVPVLGTFTDLDEVVQDFQERHTPIRRLVATPSALVPEANPDRLIARARRLGLPLVRVTSLGEGMRDAELAPLEIEDLLLRPTVQIDRQRLETFIRGKRVLVTGGGGSIGSEICTRVVAFGASDLMIVESSEPSLHHILENPTLLSSDTNVDGVIADVRDRERIREVMLDFRPEVVFHAAALKHVPYLERNWTEGIKTNVFGSVNVADAAVAAGASAMVMISTDKAIEPVSVLGATKRFAEMYCQALDTKYAHRKNASSMRLISVRFGNVLASNGSVVPKFKAQIDAGGPVTVTHPEMVRYFMTIREACDLVVTAGSHALDGVRADVAVYVLNMGQPVKILDLAERIIRLSGLEPGRDIEIAFTGMRPGERLHEILFAREEPSSEIGIAGIVAARPITPTMETMQAWLATLEQGLSRGDRSAIYCVLRDAVPDFQGEAA